MIEIKNLCKTYHLKSGDVPAIQNVNLSIHEGDIYGIIGYSGAGKSSLIRCINLLEKPDKGEIIVDGTTLVSTISKKGEEKVSIIPNRALRKTRKNIGMIFQHFNLLDRLTVYENIAYPLRYSGYDKKEIHNRVIELLSLVGLSDKINVYPSSLSGGQKQRVAIARAIASHPKVLLSDEATSALDPDATESILHLLKDLNQKLGLTIVMITHEMSVIKSICSKVAVMEDGKVVEEGDVYSIFSNPKTEVTKRFVATTSALHKVDQLLNSSILLGNDQKGKLVKLIYQKTSVKDALISEVSRKYHVDVSIVLATVEILQDAPLGGMIAWFQGNEKDIQSALTFFSDSDVKVEVIEHGRVD